VLTAGTTTLDNAMTPPRKNTTIDGLRYFFITAPITLKNMYMPIEDQKPIQRAYITFRLPNSQKVRVLEKALNKIIYMPVEAAT